LKRLESGAISRVAEDTRRSLPIDGGRGSTLAEILREARNKTSSDILSIEESRKTLRGALALGDAVQAVPLNPRGLAEFNPASSRHSMVTFYLLSIVLIYYYRAIHSLARTGCSMETSIRPIWSDLVVLSCGKQP
jgi:hypothetical protein